MIYTYDDDFLALNEEDLETIEGDTITEISKIYSGDDEFVKQKMIVCRVYMIIASKNLEGDGYKEKYDMYKKEFEYYKNLSNANGSTSSVSSVELFRC
jgi:hypothetical protein